jgi:acetyltransferase
VLEREPNISVQEIGRDELVARQWEFLALTGDAVTSGASVGFMLPLAFDDIESYWNDVAAELDTGARRLFACERNGRIVGTVQIAPCSKANGRHRAEIQKLLVHGDARRSGIGAALMEAAERVATEEGRWLLLLDTREGSAAERLYHRLGWEPYGQVGDYARDPDGTLARCIFFQKRIEGVRP